MPAKVKTWVAAHAHEIELFYLPAYAPDHNPDEYLNNDLKQKLRQQPQPAIARRADQEHPRRAARHPALTSPHPGLLHCRGTIRPTRPECVWRCGSIRPIGHKRDNKVGQ